MKLRDIEVVNDDFERQARNTTSSLEDLESKYNVAIERGVMAEEEIKVGEQEREGLRIETQRLRDELGDLKIEAEIRQDKLRHAEAAAQRQNTRKPPPLDSDVTRPKSAMSGRSPTTSTSSPTVATPPTKSTSSTVSETPTPPSPPTSDHSLPPALNTPANKLPKPRMSNGESNITPRPPTYSSQTVRHSRRLSIPALNGRSTTSVAHRTALSRPDHLQPDPTLPSSGSLHQIRGLIGKMQKLEQRVNSARSKLPAPTSTPPHASPRSNSALGQSFIPATVTMRSSKRRTGGSSASLSLQSPSVEPNRPSSRLSFGFSQPTTSPTRDANQSPSRPGSRASISSRTSLTHLPTATPSSRPSSRQSVSGARTPLGHYATTQSESRRPRSSIGGSYASAHAHTHSPSVSRLSYHSNHNPPPQQFQDDTAEEEEAADVLTPTPSRRTTFGKEDGSGIPAPGKRVGGSGTAAAGAGRRIISGPGEMGPPEKRAGRRLSGVGESF